MKIKRICNMAIIVGITLVFGVGAIYIINITKDVASAETPMSESTLALYQGASTTELMPNDLTFTKSDVPHLIDYLNASSYKAVYWDSEMCMRVTNDNSVHISKDSGITWEEYATQNISSKEFGKWLLANDPNPGYSMKEMQKRLEDGAEVKHMAFENGKEIYIVIDESGVQIELVQPERLASVLLDGQRMMITSEQVPMLISKHKLESFYNLLVSNNILTNTLAEQDYFERIRHIEENGTNFILTN